MRRARSTKALIFLSVLALFPSRATAGDVEPEMKRILALEAQSGLCGLELSSTTRKWLAKMHEGLGFDQILDLQTPTFDDFEAAKSRGERVAYCSSARKELLNEQWL